MINDTISNKTNGICCIFHTNRNLKKKYLIVSPAAASETARAIAELLTVRLRVIISSNSASLICGCIGCSGNGAAGGIACGFTVSNFVTNECKKQCMPTNRKFKSFKTYYENVAHCPWVGNVVDLKRVKPMV